MSSTIKFSLLALVSSVAAIPHSGHSKFHSLKPSGTGTGQAYPTGGWSGGYNSTRIPHASGTGVTEEDKTVDVTTTSTKTIFSTVYASPVPVSSKYAVSNVAKENVATGADSKCGATITVTASEKVTVTVTPGGGVGVSSSAFTPAPVSSAAPVESKSDYGYGVPSSKSFELVSSASKSEKATETPKAEKPVSSKAQEYVAPVSSKAPVYDAPASSKAPVYDAPVSSKAPVSVAPTPIVTPTPTPTPSQKAPESSSAAPLSTAVPSSGGSYTGVKRGLAYNDAKLCKNFGSQFGFGYNWAQVENNDIGTGYIPMMHGPSKSSAQAWLANVKKAVDKGSKAVMGFNEPDHAEQANLSPAAACTAWKEYMNPIAQTYPQVTIVGPSVTNAGSDGTNGPLMGLAWLTSFHAACPDAVVHATNIHFYDIYEKATIDRFKAQVEKAIKLFNKPVWVTEFGLNPGSATEAQAASFLKDAMAYLDNNDKVQGYSWFMVGSGENQLNTATGLSAIGKVYAGAA